jgi:23S rRNA (adenine-N6)-dimethyltransferase
VRASAPRAWGWHRLDSRWAERIVEAAQIRPGELVLDIGAGNGALTTPLLRAGARVIAVERHTDRVARLKERFAGDPVTVVCADAADLRLPRRPFRVVANPPFAISAALLRCLLAPGSRMTAADLVLQRAVVARWTSPAAPGAGRWQRRYRSEPGLRLPRRAFVPPPRVDAAVLVIRRSIGSAGG